MAYCSHWSRHTTEGAALEADWNAKFAEYEKKYPEDAATLKSIITGELPAGWADALPVSVPSCDMKAGDMWMKRLMINLDFSRNTLQRSQQTPPETSPSSA